MAKSRTAVLVIDMIKGMERWIPRRRMEGILPSLAKLLDRFRAKGIPIIYLVHTPLGKRGTTFYDEVRPLAADHVVTKEHYSGFYNTCLDSLLRRLDVKKLVIAGVSTHWCVLTTAVDASYRDYKLTLVTDCTTSPSDGLQRSAIRWLADAIDIEFTTSNRLP